MICPSCKQVVDQFEGCPDCRWDYNFKGTTNLPLSDKAISAVNAVLRSHGTRGGQHFQQTRGGK